tara:strand:+ start:11690 stop:15934 length:4245 start_codon:yes stop_codon:yes gene_type:complete
MAKTPVKAIKVAQQKFVSYDAFDKTLDQISTTPVPLRGVTHLTAKQFQQVVTSDTNIRDKVMFRARGTANSTTTTLADDLSRSLTRLPVKKDKTLTATSLITGETRIHRAIKDVAETSGEMVKKSTESQVRMSITRTRSKLRKVGHGGLTNNQVERATKRAIQKTQSPFLGKTLEQRVSTIVNKHTTKKVGLMNSMQFAGKSKKEIISQVTNGIKHNKYGVRIPTGSVYKDLDRLLISESKRSAREGVLAMCEEGGIPLVRWRLSGNHAGAKSRYKYKNEVCDVYSTMTDPRLTTLKKQENLSLGGGVDYEGLWMRDSVPAYPHPYCECWLEPVLPPVITRRHNRLINSGIDPGLLQPEDLVSRTSPNIQKLLASFDGEGLEVFNQLNRQQMLAIIDDIAEIELGILKEKGMTKAQINRLMRAKKKARLIKKNMKDGVYSRITADLRDDFANFVEGAINPEIQRGMFDTLNALAYELTGAPVLNMEVSSAIGLDNSVNVFVKTCLERGVKPETIKKAVEGVLKTKNKVLKTMLKNANGHMEVAELLQETKRAGVSANSVIQKFKSVAYQQASAEVGQGLGSLEALLRVHKAVDSVDDVVIYLRKGIKWTDPTVAPRLRRLGLYKSDCSPIQVGTKLYAKVKPEAVPKLAYNQKRTKSALDHLLVDRKLDTKPLLKSNQSRVIRKGIDPLDAKDSRFHVVTKKPPRTLQRQMMTAREKVNGNRGDAYKDGDKLARKWFNHKMRRQSGVSVVDLEKKIRIAKRAGKTSEVWKLQNEVNRQLGIYVRHNVKTGELYYLVPKYFRGDSTQVSRGYFERWISHRHMKHIRLKNAPDGKKLKGLRENPAWAKYQRLSKAKKAKVKEVPKKYLMKDGTPFNLKAEQQAAVEFAQAVEGSVLQLDVGVGKTLTGVSAGADLIEAGAVNRILIIAPDPGVAGQWASEAHKFTTHKARVFTSKKGEALRLPSKLKPGANEASFDILTADKLVEISKNPAQLRKLRNHYDMVMVDEIHLYTTQGAGDLPAVTEALHKIGKANPTLRYRTGLTGTALRQSPVEAFDMMEFLQPGFMGKVDYEAQKKIFQGMFNGKGSIVHRSGAMSDSVEKWFRSWMDDYVYTARPERVRGKFLIDHFDKATLPQNLVKESADSLRKVNLSSQMKKKYKLVESKINKKILVEQAKEFPDAYRVTYLQKQKDDALRQILRGDAYDGKNPLVREVDRIITSKANKSEKFVIHASDRKAAEMLEKEMVRKHGRNSVRRYAGYEKQDDFAFEHLKGRKPRKGEVTQWRKDHTLTVEEKKSIQKHKFNTEKQTRIMIVSDDGAQGLNLQHASARTIHFDLPKTYAQLSQRNGRNYRMGQTKNVKSYYVTTNTPTDIVRIKEIENTRRVYQVLDELNNMDETKLAETLRELKKPSGFLSELK